MKAMIMAAGYGSRLRPITDTIPKPLVDINGKSLLAHTIERLVAAGIKDIVINVSYRGEQIIDAIGDGSDFGACIHYSKEDEPLESGGGIFNALPLLGDEPFIAVNGDIWTDYPFAQLPQQLRGKAHLVLVDKPVDSESGDFALQQEFVTDKGEPCYTYAGIALIDPKLFAACSAGKFSIVPLLTEAMLTQQVSGEHYSGKWFEIGSPQRLEFLRKQFVN